MALRRIQRSPHRPRPAGAADDVGCCVGAALGVAGRGDAGRHPQPAGRPGHPRRQRRRRAVRGRRHLRVRDRVARRLRVVRVRRGALASVVVYALGSFGREGPRRSSWRWPAPRSRPCSARSRPRSCSSTWPRWTSSASGSSARSPDEEATSSPGRAVPGGRRGACPGFGALAQHARSGHFRPDPAVETGIASAKRPPGATKHLADVGSRAARVGKGQPRRAHDPPNDPQHAVEHGAIRRRRPAPPSG